MAIINALNVKIDLVNDRKDDIMFISKILSKKTFQNNIQLAYDLFDTLCVSTNEKSLIIKKILLELTDKKTGYPNREQVLLKVIELAGDDDNADSLYIKSKAYSWLKVKYNDLAIEYLRKYLNKGVSEYAINRTLGVKIPYSNKVFLHLSEVYCELGDKLIISREYENALDAYNNMLKNDSMSKFRFGRQISYLKIADTYRRMNDLDKAIFSLENASYPNDCIDDDSTISKNYIVNEFNSSISNALNDYKIKKEQGYVFRPRKKKE